MSKYPNTLGRIEAVWNKLGGEEGVDRLLSGAVEIVVKATINMTRRISVNRYRTPVEAIKATNRIEYLDQVVVDGMPRGEREEVEIHFFDLDYDPTVDELDREFETRGLKADPMGLAAVLEADPAFADERPVATQWRDSKGNACYALFGGWGDGRKVDVDRDGSRWRRGARFAGVRK